MSSQDMLGAVAIVSISLASTVCFVMVLITNAKIRVVRVQQSNYIGTISDDKGIDDTYLKGADPNLLALLKQHNLGMKDGMWSSGTIEYNTKPVDVVKNEVQP